MPPLLIVPLLVVARTRRAALGRLREARGSSGVSRAGRRRGPPAIALLLGMLAAAALSAADAPPGATLPVITDAGVFWTVPDAAKAERHPLKLELTIFYYDPFWKLLWAADTRGELVYFPVGDGDLGLKAGQRVLLEGTIVPAAGLEAAAVHVTLIEESAPLPAPLATAGAIGDASRWEEGWVSVEGFVCRQEEVDTRHLSLELLVEGRLITARLLLGETEPVPQLVDTRVRAAGVYVSKRDPSGRVQQVELWVPRRTDIAVTGSLSGDRRFELPATPIDELAEAPRDGTVRLVAQVHAQDPGRALVLRDRTGQVTIATEQPGAFQAGELVEIVGRPAGDGLHPTLQDPLWRPASLGSRRDAAAASERPTLKFRLIEQVMELRLEQAARRYPVNLKGVVTWADGTAGIFFLQDATGGIRVHQRQAGAPLPEIGATLTVTGFTGFGEFAPEVHALESTRIGWMALPAPRPVTLEQALTGAGEGQRVEMRAYVREIAVDVPWQRVDLATAEGEFSAYAPRDALIKVQPGALVRVAGVCTATANGQRQLTGIRLWLAGAEAVRVEEPAPEDPFAAPARTIASLRQFTSHNAIDRRVRVAGCVLHQEPGRYLYLQDGDAALVVLSRSTEPLEKGAWVEVAGFPGREGSRLVLREAVWRRGPAGRMPEPLALDFASALDPEVDGRLVRMRAVLQQLAPGGRNTRLILSVGGGAFEAELDRAWAELPRAGSVLELTGVHVLEYDEYRRPRGFHLLVNSPRDVGVIRAASWWTAPRALAIAGAFAVCTVLGLAWVTVLRRRVNAQTRQIRAQLEKEAQLQAELERTRRLESLGVLAGGIAHDFNNLLTVVIANLSLASLDRRVAAAAGDILGDAERAGRRAAELTQQLLTFARGGDPVRTAVALPDLVRESAKFALHGSSVQCEVEVAPDLPPANIDRAQVGRVIHNLVLNAVQAMPQGGHLHMKLAAVVVAKDEMPTLVPGRYLKLTVADDGPGIPAENLLRIFDPYFSTKAKNSGLGLATVHSIVKKHQGHITVESVAGSGTVFHIWLPASTAVPAQPTTASLAPRLAGGGGVRVLFMDDEERIRQTAAGVLRELGHDFTMVADGADAVRLYREARESGRPFDAVILDLTVPGGMGGKAAMEELRKIDPLVRAIVSSGYSSDPVMAHYRAYGFLAAVPKPYGVRELGAAIEAVMPPYRHGQVEAGIDLAAAKR